MNPEDWEGLDEMFGDLVDYQVPLYRRIYYYLLVGWANFNGRVRKFFRASTH